MKWILVYGPKLLWNSVTSTFKAPSNLKDAINDEIDDLRNKAIKVGIGGTLDVKRMSADVIAR